MRTPAGYFFQLAPSCCLSRQYSMNKKLIEVDLSLIVIEQTCFKK